MPETRYARCGDLSLAYQVFGSGDVDIVVSGSFVSNVEVMWGSPEFSSFFDHLASFSRVLLYDKTGVGLSDPVMQVSTIEQRAEELEAVMDAAGFERAALVGISEGGPASIVFAAAHPNRVRALVLMGSTAVPPIPFNKPWEGAVDSAPSESANTSWTCWARRTLPTMRRSTACRRSAGRSATRGGRERRWRSSRRRSGHDNSWG